MWKPPERIVHKTISNAWPTAPQAQDSVLFAPYKNGRFRLSQRTWIPAMVPWRATEEGFVTDDVIDWYRRFAEGKPGAIVVEATGVRDVPSGPLLRAGHDRFLPGLEKLVSAVREASDGETKLFIQLIDFLAIKRRPQKEKFIGRHLEITDRHRRYLKMDRDDETVRNAMLALDDEALKLCLSEREYESYSRGYRERVTDTHLPHIAELPKCLPEIFSNAAARAEQAGFDGVELHYAHAYTMASFLSKLNTRSDGYGGDRDSRLRLPLEVYECVRAQTSDRFLVGCRFLSDECINGGSDLQDAMYFASAFAKAGMDFLSLSRGGKFEDAAEPKVGQAIYPYTGRSGYECMPQIISDAHGPFGRNINAARNIRNAVRAAGCDTPIIAAGGIHHFDQANAVLKNGDADIIGLARQAMADPDWFEKVRTGNGDAVNVCKYTNYCEGLDQKHKMVTCQLWDRKEMDEPGLARTPDGKRRTTAPAWRR